MRQVAAPDGAVVAVTARDRRLVAEPRMVVPVEVPEVLMGVDDGFAEPAGGVPRVDGHARPPSGSRPGPPCASHAPDGECR